MKNEKGEDMRRWINDFILMLQFLTRIPINCNLQCEKEDFRRGAAFLPIIGLLIGLIQWLIFYIFFYMLRINLSATLTLCILTAPIITGGLHIDGLGDTCDGFFSCKGKDRIIEIMKDSRIGTFACIAILGDILLRYSLLPDCIIKGSCLILIVAPVIGRFSIVFLSTIGKNAKPTGSGNLFIGNMGKIEVTIASVITLVITIIMLGVRNAVFILLSAIILTTLFNMFCKSKIGGITGDSLGANNELVEILVLFVYYILI